MCACIIAASTIKLASYLLLRKLRIKHKFSMMRRGNCLPMMLLLLLLLVIHAVVVVVVVAASSIFKTSKQPCQNI